MRPHAVTIHRSGIDGPSLAALHWESGPGAPGVVVVHGAGSRKENHSDFSALLSSYGFAVLTPDLRGHGASGGRAGRGMLDDVLTSLDWLAGRGHAVLGLRGSSLGGFLALHAADRHACARAVVAICPARPESLARRYGDDWPLSLPLGPAVVRSGVARGFWHASGDEVVPWAASFALAQATPHPRRLHVTLGGHHRSLQHDPQIQSATAEFLRTHLRAVDDEGGVPQPR